MHTILLIVDRCVFAMHMRYHWLRTTDSGHGAVTWLVFCTLSHLVSWRGWFLRHSQQWTSSSMEETWWFKTIQLVPWLKTEKTSVEQMWYICHLQTYTLAVVLCHMCFAWGHVEWLQEFDRGKYLQIACVNVLLSYITIQNCQNGIGSVWTVAEAKKSFLWQTGPWTAQSDWNIADLLRSWCRCRLPAWLEF